MIFRKYFKKEFDKDFSVKENKIFFYEKCLKKCDYLYSGKCEDFGINPNSTQGKEYSDAEGSPCHYISCQELDHPFVFEGKTFQVMGISQRLFGRLLRSNSGNGVDLNVLFDAVVAIETWEDDYGTAHESLKLQCISQQQRATLAVNYDA